MIVLIGRFGFSLVMSLTALPSFWTWCLCFFSSSQGCVCLLRRTIIVCFFSLLCFCRMCFHWNCAFFFKKKYYYYLLSLSLHLSSSCWFFLIVWNRKKTRREGQKSFRIQKRGCMQRGEGNHQIKSKTIKRRKQGWGKQCMIMIELIVVLGF